MYIDNTSLELLLERNREKIGFSNNWIESVLAGITFIVSTIFASYKNYKYLAENSIKIICVILGIIYIGLGVKAFVSSKKNRYNHKKLFSDIKELDQITHPFSIVAIKDTFNLYPNKFLLYYDTRWKCDFFFSFRTTDNNNTQNIIEKLSNELKIDKKNIKVDYINQKIQSKFSESDKETKTYEHKLYRAKILLFSDIIKQDSFEIDGKKFKWMTIEQMEQDKNINKKNSDVVSFVKAYT